MKKPYTLLSKDIEKLLEMLALRRAGYSFNFLADLYDCDRTTLRYQCRKYQIFPIKQIQIPNSKAKEIFNPERIVHDIIITITPKQTSNWIIIDGERINAGKSYAEYLRDNSPYKNRF